MDRFEEALEKQAEAERKLGEIITGMVKEMYRLSLPVLPALEGPVHYEPTTPELEEAVIGRDE